MKIVIIDDEPLARSRLLAMVTELDAGEVVGEADNGADALRLVEQAGDRKSTRLNSSHSQQSRMPSSA